MLLAAFLGGIGCSPNPETSAEPEAAPAEAAQDAPAAKAEPVGAVEPAEAEPAAEPEPEPEPPAPAWTPRPEDVVTPHEPLVNPEALATFYDHLAAIDDGEAKDVVRVVHLGASMIGADDLPAILRAKFQTRFGDGGAGLVLLHRYMANYLHRWVKISSSGWDSCYIAYKCKNDGHYGLGGTTFWAKDGATSTISTRKDKELGTTASHIEFWYLAHPKGGRFDFRVDGGSVEQIDTRSDVLEDRYHTVDVEPGPHKVRVRALKGYGIARGYGVVLETAGPGLVWDQFSMLGAFTRRMLLWDEGHIAGHVKQRDPDLLVFTYGGNDTRRVFTGKLTEEGYIEEYVSAIQRVRAGKPEASCLVTAMTDRAKSLEYKLRKNEVETIAHAQRKVAEKAGCAFFDSFGAMGGAGSLKKWRAKDPPLASADLKHLNHRGRLLLGGWIYDAIINGYVEYRKAKGAPGQ